MVELDSRTFRSIQDLVYLRSGIKLGEGKQSLVSARLSKRLQGLGLANYQEYLRYVEADDGEEIVQMLDAISTNVTHFFREAKHFELVTKLVTAWLEQGQTKFRFWSAASSTGEEPYTLAMTLADCFEGRGAIDWKILATDISTRVLNIAKRGEYPASRVRDIPPAMLMRYFDKRGRGDEATYVAKDSIRSRLLFTRLNLNEEPYPMHGPLDIIMCRNVMIYFDNIVRTRLLGEFQRLLKTGGYLLVGHAESLTGLLCPLRSVSPSVYRKDKQ
jgi:chemotaxis protein methyltransferase CheR